MKKVVCILIILGCICWFTLFKLVTIVQIEPGIYSRIDGDTTKTIVITDQENATCYNLQDGVRLIYPLKIKNDSFYNKDLGVCKFKIIGNDLIIETMSSSGDMTVTYHKVKKMTEIKPSQEIKPSPTPYNFDGKYKNKNGAIWEIKENQAKLYVESDGPEFAIIDDIVSESTNDDQKVLKYKYFDGSGGYTIVIYKSGKLLFTDDDPKRNISEVNQFQKQL